MNNTSEQMSEATYRAVEREMHKTQAGRDETYEKCSTGELDRKRDALRTTIAEMKATGRTTYRATARLARMDAEIQRRTR